MATATATKKAKKMPLWLSVILYVIWVGGVLFAAEWLIAIAMMIIVPEENLQTNTINAIYQGITYAFSMAVIIALPWKFFRNKTNRDELGLRGLPTCTDILLSPVAFCVAIVASGILTYILMAILPGIDWEQAQNVGFHNLHQLPDFCIAFFCLVILAPVCEEIIFRGWLYGKLRAKMKALPAILFVSLLFAIMHGQINVGVTVFAMSIVLCIQRELTGTIWSGILMHMIKNAIAFYFLFAA